MSTVSLNQSLGEFQVDQGNVSHVIMHDCDNHDGYYCKKYIQYKEKYNTYNNNLYPKPCILLDKFIP